MFKWLSGKSRFIRYPDNYAQTDQVMIKQVCQCANQQLEQGDLVFVVVYFPAMFEQIQRAFDELGIEYQVVLNAIDFQANATELARKPSEIRLALANSLLMESPPGSSQSTLEISMIMCEPIPLVRTEDEFNYALRHTPHMIKLGYFMSLEHALVKYCLTDKMMILLEQLGIGKHELISSELISRRVRTRLSQLQGKRDQWDDADSAEEWLRINLS